MALATTPGARHSAPTLLALAAALFVLAVSAQSPRTSTVYFRKRTLGNVFALDSSSESPSEIELDGTADAPRFVALALTAHRLFWSDHRSIRSAAAADGSDVRTEIGSLARVRWFGVNFGSSAASDSLELSILGTACVSVVQWTPTAVECVVALPNVGAVPSEDDCVIHTQRGEMRGAAHNRYAEMRASGLLSPLVERMEIETTTVAPQAMVIDGEDALFWANAVDGVIYRSSLRDTSIDVVQKNAWAVKGLSLLRWPPARAARTSPTLELLYSLEGKGSIQRTQVVPGLVGPSDTLVSGLRSPRGLAVDPAQRFLYWTEKTGRIYRVSLAPLSPMDSSPSVDVVLPPPQRLLTLSTLTRLDGLAVDDLSVYWCESNANVVARAPIDTLQREVLVGGSANSALSWPRSVVLRSTNGLTNAAQDDFYYAEYTGRISKGKAAPPLVNDLRTSTMKYLDQLIQQRGSHLYFYALE